MIQVNPQVSALPAVNTQQKKADRWLLGGAVLTGSLVLGIFGLIPLLYALRLQWKLYKSGENVRPWSAVVIGGFCLIDCSLNLCGWSLALYSHDSGLASTFLNAYGLMGDGGYHFGWNQRPVVGGVEPTTEIMIIITSTVILFPMRIAAAWAFLNMRAWGLHFMKVTTWLYFVMWVGYTMMMMLDFEERLRPAEFGIVGWWIFNGFYFTPMLTLPYLYTLDRKLWNR